MPVFEDDKPFQKWWNSFPYNTDSLSKKAIAYEAWKAAKRHKEPINTIPDGIKKREDFLDNFNAN